MRSALYHGKVRHERLRPKRHALRYAVFSMVFDLDELPTLHRQLKLFRHNGRAVFSFRDTDHGDGVTPLRQWAARQLSGAGISWDGGRVELLCYPRLLGYVFNPLTVWYCHQQSGELAGILYEVHNTQGERHTYPLPVADSDGDTVRHACAKQFFVSPFVPMEAHYSFRIRQPGDRAGLSIVERDRQGVLLTASFIGERQELTDRTLLAALIRYPLMTLGVTLAIHWEAMKLLLKGVPFLRWSPTRKAVPQASQAPVREDEPVS